MLEQQVAARGQMGRRIRHDGADTVQAIGAVGERHLRLERQAVQGEVRIARGHVGRIGNDQIEAFTGQRCEPAACAKIDAGAQATGIGPGHDQGGR